jgi:hypothetical protein
VLFALLRSRQCAAKRPLADTVGSPRDPGLQGGVVPDRYPAIEDHAVIGDLHTVALVPTAGTIDWRSLPRFGSPAVFASLPDADRGGSFAVRCEAVRTRQQYLVGAGNLVTLCDLGILVDQATEPVPAENRDVCG